MSALPLLRPLLSCGQRWRWHYARESDPHASTAAQFSGGKKARAATHFSLADFVSVCQVDDVLTQAVLRHSLHKLDEVVASMFKHEEAGASAGDGASAGAKEQQHHHHHHHHQDSNDSYRGYCICLELERELANEKM
jgi:hypothetical protein